MKGTVIKRGRRWSVVLDMGRDPTTGRRVRKWHSGFERKRDAEAARIELLSRVQQGNYVGPSKMTIGEWMETWLDGRVGLKTTTLAAYRNEVRRITAALGLVRLSDLRVDNVNRFYCGLAETLSPKTVRNCHGVLRKALTDARKAGHVVRNVAEDAELPRADRPSPEAWTVDELNAFLAHIAQHRLYAAWVLLASTGMRRSELLGLAWRNVDLDAAQLAVMDTLVVVENRPMLRLGETKTPGSRRMIALDIATVAALRAHRARQAEEKLVAGATYRDQGLVFANEIGDVVSPDWFTRSTKRFAMAAGVRPLTPHPAGRHTFATLAMEAGIAAKVVADRLGHSSVGTTLDMYTHPTERMDRDAAETVAALLRSG